MDGVVAAAAAARLFILYCLFNRFVSNSNDMLKDKSRPEEFMDPGVELKLLFSIFNGVIEVIVIFGPKPWGLLACKEGRGEVVFGK